MAVERPTFSESWYRVNHLSPRLRSTAQVYRQHYRGRMWHVIHDPSSNQFFRLSEAAYTFVGLLDGRRTVAEAWRICNEQLGDAAPTQGEAIQLLGQMYTSNLLAGDMPPDAEGLLKRYRQRVQREVTNYLKNFLFIRIPLLDPDRFLDWGLPLVRWIWSWIGLALLLAAAAVGGYFVIADFDKAVAEGNSIFNRQDLMSNLPLLYLSFVLVKVIHEFGHAFACKKFGRQGGTGGEVHVMGVMFLIFTPLPYVDASSAWAFRSKWHRVVVGMGGMLVELFLAAVAAVIWYHTPPGFYHSLSYNVMFIASVSTLLFNGNPLLRYDAYYIASDLLEMPNLYQRSKDYIYYLVKKYVWKVQHPRNPAHTPGEKVWLTLYGIASSIYKVFIFAMILLFLTARLPDELFVVGVILGVAGGVVFLCVPVFKFIHYLATHNELMRVRARAVVSSLAVVATVGTLVGILPFANHLRAEGFNEFQRKADIHAGADGFVTWCRPSGQSVQAGEPLVRAENEDLALRRRQLQASRDELHENWQLAKTKELAKAQALAQQIAVVDEQIDYADRQLAALVVRAPFDGTWEAPQLERHKGVFVTRGDPIGQLITTGRLVIKAVADQKITGIFAEQDALARHRQGAIRQGRALLAAAPASPGGLAAQAVAAAVLDAARAADDELYRRVEIRVKGQPDRHMVGRYLGIAAAAQTDLPSQGMAAIADGPLVTAPDKQGGMKAAEGFFLIRVEPDGTERLLEKQRVIVRFDLPKKPLAAQWWRSLRQLFQRRFRV